jgi:predicted ATPase/DNA-binding winged helix-turn-helix (wHTH) protein
MSPMPSDRIFSFANWAIDAGRKELRLNDVAVPMGSRAFQILETLAAAAGTLVTKNDLFQSVWPGLAVEENTLQVHISAVRKALGEDRGLLKTISGRGYVLGGSWRLDGTSDRSPPGSRLEVQADRWLVNNLPSARASLVGRDGKLNELVDILSDYRAVTLTGPGGIGKTKLAIELARRVKDSFGDAVALVELGTIMDSVLVAPTTARVLRLAVNPTEISAVTVAEAVGGRRLLLVLDNCEHLIDTAAELADAVLRRCPNATVLATSRESLRIEGEYVAMIPPLSVPDETMEEPELLLSQSAVQLFIARMEALRSNFVPTPRDFLSIGALCRRLDGIPLALEFAAARSATLGIEAVLLRLDKRFELLTGGRRDQLQRHQTLRATLDWSYDLLSGDEQELLCYLAVFPAGFTLDGAVAMMEDRLSRPSVIEALSNLIGKSLVSVDPSISGRWRLLETTRAYGLEVLARKGLTEDAARRHARFFWQMIAIAGDMSHASGDLSRYANEIGNVHAALDWAFTVGGDIVLGVELTAAYAPVWMQLLAFVECATRIEKALAHIAPDSQLDPTLAAQLYVSLGFALLNTTGTAARMKAASTKGLELAERLGNRELQLKAVWTLWSYNLNSGQYAATKQVAEQYLTIARQTTTPGNEAVGRRLLGAALHFYGQQSEAGRQLSLSLQGSAHRSDGTSSPMWFLLNQSILAKAMLARVLLLKGRIAESRALALESFEEARAENDKLSIAYALRNAVCPIALMTRDLPMADRSVSWLLELVTREGIAFWASWTSCLKGQLQVLHGEAADGVTSLRIGLQTRAENGWLMRNPEFLGSLAEGLLGLGNTPAALCAVDKALEIARQGHQMWCFADLLRIKGEILLPADQDQSEALFAEGLALAREQECRFYELKLAVSMARLMISAGRKQAAIDLLKPTHDEFDGDVEIPDIISARHLMEEAAGLTAGRRIVRALRF